VTATTTERGRADERGVAHAVGAYLRVFVGLRANAWRLLIGNLCLNTGLGVFGVLFNLYLIALGHSFDYIGLVAAATTVGQAAAAPLVGQALRRFDERTVMMAGAGGMAFAYVLSALVTNATLLIVAAGLSGAAFSIAVIPALPYMMSHATARQRTHLFSAYFASNTLGTMVGSLLSGAVPALAGQLLLSHAHGHGHGRGHGLALAQETVGEDRAGLLVGAAIAAIGVYAFWLLRPQTPSADSLDRPARPGEEGRDARRIRRDVLVMLAATAVIAVTMGATLPFFNVYFSTRLHTPTGTIGVIYAVSGLICAIAAFLTPIVGRWGRLPGFSATRILTAPAFLVLWLHPTLALAAPAYVARNAIGTISGALENMFAMEVLPARLRGTVASWRSFCYNGAWSVGSLVAGVVVGRYGYDALFVAAAVLTLAGSAFYWGYFARRPSS